MTLDLPANVLDTEAVVQKFQSRLRVIIQELKDIAHETKYNVVQAKSVYPLSYSFWFLLRQVSTDDFMAAYIAAIPRKVQVVLGQTTLTPEAILSVDRDWKHHNCGGVYINPSRIGQEYGYYVGSTTRAFSMRIMEHFREWHLDALQIRSQKHIQVASTTTAFVRRE